MPGASGLDLLERLGRRGGGEAVVLMSALANSREFDEALARGARGCIAKPFKLDEVATAVARALRGDGRSGSDEFSLPFERSAEPSAGPQLVGRSAAITHLLEIVERVALTESSVLITGATGTGKEVVARALHACSLRARAPFVDINCSAIPDTLIESELFGHQRGSFTGAQETRRGLFEQATGGTLFLDEVDALCPAAQVKLLRVLQERQLRRVGGRENIKIDVRIVAATNRDLHRAVEGGDFRADLLYRLRVVPLHLPELRERPEDIELLAGHFLKRHASASPRRRFTEEALRALTAYGWPGNVRELENAVEYALAIGRESELGVEDLPPDVLTRGATGDLSLELSAADDLPLTEVERRYVLLMFERHGRHHGRTADALGIDRRTLYNKLRQYGPDFRRAKGGMRLVG